MDVKQKLEDFMSLKKKNVKDRVQVLRLHSLKADELELRISRPPPARTSGAILLE